MLKFDSQEISGEFYLDLYSYEVNKWYFLKISYDPSKNKFSNFNKNITNIAIAKKILKNWKDEASILLDLTNDLTLNENENKSKMILDGFASFKSSWGVWNHSNKSVKASYIVNENMIKKTSSINENDDSYVFEEIKLNNFYYLPLIEIIDPLVGKARWTQISFEINRKKN